MGSRFFTSSHVLVFFKFVVFYFTESSVWEHRRCSDVCVCRMCTSSHQTVLATRDVLSFVVSQYYNIPGTVIQLCNIDSIIMLQYVFILATFQYAICSGSENGGTYQYVLSILTVFAQSNP